MAGFLENLLKYSTRPIRDLVELGNVTQKGLGVKRVEAPEYTLKQLQDIADNGGSKAFLGSGEQKKYAKDIKSSQGAFDKVKNYKPVALKDDEMEGLLGYDRAFKDAAIAGSFMVPGIGSGLGGALATGAVSGGLGGFGGSKKGEELGSTLGGAALGGALGGAGYGITKGLGALANKAKSPNINTKLIKGSASKVGMSPTQFKDANTKLLQDMVDNGFDVSSPKNIANNLDDFLKQASKTIDDYAALAEGTPNLSGIQKIINEESKYLPNSGASKKLASLTNDLVSNKSATYNDVFKYTQELDSLRGGFKKVNTESGVLTAQTIKSLRNAARDITSGNSQLDDALGVVFNALDLKDTVLKNPEITSKIGLSALLVRGNVNVRPVADAIRKGGTLQSKSQGLLGKGAEGISGLNLGKAVGPLTGAGMMGLGQEEQSPQGMGQDIGQPLGIEDAGMMAINKAFSGVSEQSGQGQGSSVQDAITKAVQMMPNASESEIMSLAKMFMTESGGDTGEMTSGGKQAEGDAESALQILDKLETTMDESKNLIDPIKGTLGMIPYVSPETQNLNSSIMIVRQLVGKFLEKGVLRKEDEEKYAKMLPNVNDVYSVAVQKLRNTREAVADQLEQYRKSGYIGYGGETTDNSISDDYNF